MMSIEEVVSVGAHMFGIERSDEVVEMPESIKDFRIIAIFGEPPWDW